ncbi:MAG: hypothetical protein RL322_1681 [Pseudomonadota bacterium]|jgi:predicted esterase YcpF (UPF0227 family)
MSASKSAPPARRVLYLHGFRSSPASFKARLLAQAMTRAGRANDFICPQLPDAPEQAWTLIVDQIRVDEHDLVVGSSLGGFYAHAVAEQTGCRAVLLNPAMDAPRLLAHHLGRHTRWHDESISVDLGIEDLEALRRIGRTTLTRTERYLLIAATGDDVIDWQDMVRALPGVRSIIVEGSDHALSDFPDYLDTVLAFAGMTPERAPGSS